MSIVTILLSDKRSGSTMFQDEMLRHPAVSTVPYSPHTYLETHWWLMGAVLLERPGSLFVWGERYRGYGSSKNARAYMLDLLEKCVPEWKIPEDDRALVFGGWEALCRRFARPVFFEKSPQVLAQWAALSLLLEWMDCTEFEVRVIGLVRNPHGVMHSARELFGTDPDRRQFAWLVGCRNMLALEQMLPPDSFIRVRYEDLVADPVEGFRKIAHFVGIPADPACGSGVRSTSTFKWREDPQHSLALDPAVAQMAIHLGYPPEELANSHAGVAVQGKRATSKTWRSRLRHQTLKPLILRARSAMRVSK
jgi:hypothetical protein